MSQLPYRRLSDPPRNWQEKVADKITDIIVALLVPVEKLHAWSWYRSFGKGRK